MAETELVDGYARALLEVLRAEGELDRAEDELFQFGKALETNHRLKQALSDQALPVQEREKALDAVLGKKVSPASLHALNFIVAQGRARHLPAILDRLAGLAAEERAAVVAEVRSAVGLDDDQKRRLADALSKATGRKVEVKIVIDPSVIGGLVAKVGDSIIDGTVRRRLEQLKDKVRG